MVSGQSASIEAVEELPYTELTGTAQGGAQALTSTQFKLVGVKLDVEATLVDSNNIFLTVKAEQNVAVGQSTTLVPIVDTRKAKSSLMLRQGQVVVFGGLRRQDKTKTTKQIPILGDIPILGELFKKYGNGGKELRTYGISVASCLYAGQPVDYSEKSDGKVQRYYRGTFLEYR